MDKLPILPFPMVLGLRQHRHALARLLRAGTIAGATFGATSLPALFCGQVVNRYLKGHELVPDSRDYLLRLIPILG